MADFPFEIDEVDKDKPAITAGGQTYTYGQLAADVATSETPTMARKRIYFCIDDNPYQNIYLYLACLRIRTCISILPKGTNLDTMLDYGLLHTNAKPALLITTSGSTGSKKFVKLTLENLTSNCNAICKSLPIRPDDTAGLVLPMSYSYGLSIINTHLQSGAHIHVMSSQFGTRRFWRELADNRISSLALVPSHLSSLKLGSFETLLPRTLRYITIAGGGLDKMGWLKAEKIRARGIEVYVMYGQTEATARITCLQSSDFMKKRGSVGKPIDGTLSIDPETGEVLYDGPNVFSGYATNTLDLLEMQKPPFLRTGDLGRIDDDGYLWITGRLKRIAKINSQRVSLDELEQQLIDRHGVPIKCVSDDRLVYCCSQVDLPRPNDTLVGNIVMVKLDEFPITSTGKTDYVKLLEVACSMS